jgi:hypothetical protein
LQIVYSHFAEFLKEKGMAKMTLLKINSTSLKGWVDGLIYLSDLKQLLKNVRQDEELRPLLKRPVVFEPDRNEPKLWLGIYGRTQAPYWSGFQFSDINASPTVWMKTQGCFRGDVKETDLKSHLGPTLKKAAQMFGYDREYERSRNQTWFTFSQKIDSGFNGNPDKIHEWLFQSCIEFSGLPKMPLRR